MYSKLQDGSFMVCGYVARDAELKTTQTGKTMARWSVAVGKKDTADGNKETIWTSCQAWHDTAKLAGSIRKGDTVLCIGRIDKNEYNGKTYKNLVVEFFCKMGEAASTPAQAASPQQNAGISAEDDLSEFVALDDGELPF